MRIKPRGFTLFFAVLVAGLALSVGLAIYDLTVRELDLSSTVEQSQYAIYAADTGAECALYWDTKCTPAINAHCLCTGYDTSGNCISGTAFATSSANTGVPANSGLYCNGIDITSSAAGWNSSTLAASAATTSFAVTFPAPEQYCVLVSVAKNGNPAQTAVTSYGFNNGSGSTCAAGSVLQVQRILQVNY